MSIRPVVAYAQGIQVVPVVEGVGVFKEDVVGACGGTQAAEPGEGEFTEVVSGIKASFVVKDLARRAQVAVGKVEAVFKFEADRQAVDKDGLSSR